MAWHDEDLITVRSALVSAIAEVRGELMRASELADDGAFALARRSLGVAFDRAGLLDRWHERHPQPADA
jgi:hypothetical protein